MDRSVVSSSTILVCFLLFFFTFSSARIPFDSTVTNIDQTNHDSFLVSENNPADVDADAILLPSDKPDSEPATLIQWEAVETTEDPKTIEAKAETVESMKMPIESYKPVPFTVFTVRPIVPRIPRRPLPLTFRLGHRCRHKHHYKPWNPRLPRREISHGNDVLQDNKDFDPVAARGGVRDQVPADQWMRFGHVEPMFSRERNMAMERSELLRKIYHRYQHRRPEPEIKDTGFMKRIRKFLNRF